MWLGCLAVVVLLSASWVEAPGAWAQSPEAQAGKAAFDARCARCHQAVRLEGYLAKRPDDATRAADLETFLARHHASDATERKAIIAWLLAQRTTP